MRVTLRQAINFHGHLGPYLVLGLLMGELALKILKARAHFGLEAYVWGADKRPKSCLVDGLQLSCGCTYGKGNIKMQIADCGLRNKKIKIEKRQDKNIKVRFINRDNKKEVMVVLNDEMVKKLEEAKTHQECELLARKIFKSKSEEVFKWLCQG